MSDIRSKIQASIDAAWDEYRKELYRRRLEHARTGFNHFKGHRIQEAVKEYQTYLRCLEEWKKVGEGGLVPALFDPKIDEHKLLVLCAIYWDLAKAFDRTKSKEKLGQLSHYLNKYILFTKGTKHEGLSMETIRKYVRNDKPVHKAAFKEAYIRMGGEKCFIATAVMEFLSDDDFIHLRKIRDEKLSRTFGGRLFIQLYYRVGPFFARKIAHFPEILRRYLARFILWLAHR